MIKSITWKLGGQKAGKLGSKEAGKLGGWAQNFRN